MKNKIGSGNNTMIYVVIALVGGFLLFSSGIFDKVKHHKLIIPGYSAGISGELEEELPDWEIQIGPREGAHIPGYLKSWN